MSIDEDRYRTAVEWMIRLDTATPEEHAAFGEWLRESRANTRAFIDVLTLRFEIARAAPRTEPVVQAVGETRDVADCDDDIPNKVAKTDPAEAPPTRIEAANPKRVCWAIAATAAFATVLIAWSGLFKPTAGNVLITDAGKLERLTLEDGSKLVAAPRTRLVIEFTDEVRRIRLERGAAMFHVATDPGRPFLVESNLGIARAVGTAFLANLDDPKQFKVTVEHGLVAVTRHEHEGDPDPDNAMLKGGEEVIVSREGALTPREADVEMTTAWTNGRLIFKNDSVEHAVREFNRFNKLQIRVLDPVLRQHILTGSFDAADPLSLVAYLERHGNVDVIDDNAGTLFIVPKTGGVTIERSK